VESIPILESWRSTVGPVLDSDEKVLASFEPNLDAQLHFQQALLVLTPRRLIQFLRQQHSCQSWPVGPDLGLALIEQGSVGTLELQGPSGRISSWRFTIGQSSAARVMCERLEAVQTGQNLQETSICPSCGAIMPATATKCPACAPQSEVGSLASLFRLVSFARPRLAMIILSGALTLASTAVGLIPPYLTIPLLDEVLIPYQSGKPAAFSLVYWYLGGLLIAAFLGWLLGWASSYVSAWVSERISADLRRRTYAHLQRLSLEFFGGRRTGDLLSRISTDTDRLCNFLSLHLIDFVKDILMIVMTAGILLWLDPMLALAALLPFPIIVWLVQWFRSRLLRHYIRSTVAWADMTSVLTDTISGIRVVKAFAQEQREIDRFNETDQRVVASNDRVNRMWAFLGPVITLLTTVGLLIVWAFAAYRVYQSSITVGILTAFIAYITSFYARSESLISIFSSVQRAAASASRIFEILDRVPSVPEPTDPVVPARIEGAIELSGIRFKYGQREVIHGIDLTIRPGEMIGLVGPSGAGKSTLINLICRFFDVAQGSIRIDGHDIRTMPIEVYRKNIGIVLQEPFLFYGTVAENIAYGRPGATRQEIVAAARAARAHEFILKLADGYDSIVGERGQSLSGGERQRISIARALLIDPRILILDEATSSVDTETERDIQAALDVLIKGRTTIAIAHRLSTLRRADRIVVIDNGRIVETGTHPELLRLRGKYAQLHRAQIEMVQGHAV